MMYVLVTQLCPTLCDPMDSNLPGSSVHGILQARILQWVASSFSNRNKIVLILRGLTDWQAQEKYSILVAEGSRVVVTQVGWVNRKRYQEMLLGSDNA